MTFKSNFDHFGANIEQFRNSCFSVINDKQTKSVCRKCVLNWAYCSLGFLEHNIRLEVDTRRWNLMPKYHRTIYKTGLENTWCHNSVCSMVLDHRPMNFDKTAGCSDSRLRNCGYCLMICIIQRAEKRSMVAHEA